MPRYFFWKGNSVRLVYCICEITLLELERGKAELKLLRASLTFGSVEFAARTSCAFSNLLSKVNLQKNKREQI